ncbi:MAG: tyrosine-type recombinase/integrase [Silvanigrellales bacterium]|nr:tyrosine-type recombinase/integrase [Silvanigrellales bacterium]
MMLTPESVQPEESRAAVAVVRPDPSLDLPGLVARFLLTCGSAATRHTYRSVLRDFAPSYEALSHEHAAASRLVLASELYTADLRRRLAARAEREATVKRKLSALSSFLSFCVDQGFLVRNPLARVKRPTVRPDTSADRALTLAERDRLLAQARLEREDAATGTRAAQNRAWKIDLAVRLCLSCGCRVGELLRLRPCDIEMLDETKARLVFLAKGGERHAPPVRRALAAELQAFAAANNGAEAPSLSLFAGHAQPKTAEESLNATLTALAERAAINKRVTIHTLRATCATLLHDAGTPVGHIQRLLGHKHITTTISYIRSNDSDILVSL